MSQSASLHWRPLGLAVLSLALSAGAQEPGPPRDKLDAPGAPDARASAMYTLQDLCNRLDDGTPGAKRNVFAEPSAGPGATGCTLDQIMALLPKLAVGAATPAQVLSGTFFWGLTATGWGKQTGAAHLASGTATAAQVLQDVTFSNDSGAATGAMPTQTLSAASATVNAGYYAATTLSAVDADLKPENIKWGHTLFGVFGTVGTPIFADRYQPIDVSGAFNRYGPIIRDTATNLEWQRCSVGQIWDADNESCNGTAPQFNWNDAALQTADGGFRLPTINELRTLIYCSSGEPITLGMPDNSAQCSGTYDSPTIVAWAFPPTTSNPPPTTSNYSSWSASEDATNTDYARYVFFGSGIARNTKIKTSTCTVRLVRGGQ